ncbi:hypothetical protein [uncultured Microscilla sp.]|uniref:hypothetical protein n=1 Tax=uncultured Microscilla sp. TaxID=432653 RepID=UPI00260F49F7|nr:hypothetical protein [uncultured Microscilla sp.]
MKKMVGLLVLCLLVHCQSMGQVRLNFDQIPAHFKAKAPVIVLGRYQRFRGPCRPAHLKGGKMGRRWQMHEGFDIVKAYKGNIKLPLVKINRYSLPKSQPHICRDLKVYRYYWVLIRPADNTQKAFSKEHTILPYLVSFKEIVAIYPAKKPK